MRILSSLIVSGVLDIDTINNAAADTDKFLVADANGVVKFRTGAEVASDIGAANIAASQLKHTVKAAVALTKGQAVYVSGADGTNMLVSKSSNLSESTSTKTMGLIDRNLAINDMGDVITEGLLAGLNTSTATIGDPVWLGVDGNLLYGVANKPVAPAHMVFIGIVTRVQTNNGEIFVKVQNGFELEELHNVLITGTPVDKAVIQYDTASGLWKNSTLGGVTASTGTAGQVAYFTGATTQGGSNNLFWDSANSRLGIGTNAPARTLHLVNESIPQLRLSDGSANFWDFQSVFFQSQLDLFLSNQNGVALTINATRNVGIGTNNPTQKLNVVGTILNTSGYILNRSDNYGVFTGASDDLGIYHDGTNSYLSNATGALIFNNPSERMRLHATGNLHLGGTSDSGQRLQVTGDTLLKGSGNTSATNGLIVQDSGGNALLRVRNDSLLRIGNYNTLGIAIFPYTTVTSAPDVNGSNLSIFTYETTGQTLQGVLNIAGSAFSGISGTQFAVVSSKAFFPTSGTANYANLVLNPIINQTGGANGISRGLYVAPILTAAADWRSIETSNNSGWAFYGAGTANSFFGGNIGIGATGLSSTNLRITKNITGLSVSNGISHSGQVQSDVTTVAAYFQSVASTQAAAFTTEIKHYAAQQGTFGAGSTVSVQYGFEANSTLIGATTNYAFYGNIPSGTNRWNLYMNGTANNYMAGSLGIGTTGLSNTNLSVNKNLTGLTNVYGIFNSGSIRSDVTFGATMFSSSPSIQNAVFTLPGLKHFEAVGISSVGSATIATQFGFFVESTLSGATTNYGFYGNLASGTGRWNLFMDGTANNFMRGSLLVGTSTTSTGEALQVTGTAKITGASTFARITATTSGIELNYNSGILYHIGGSGNYYQYIEGANYTFRNRTATGSLIFATQDITRLTIASDGAIRLHSYGTGARTGTVAYNLAVDASGNIIETAGGVVDGSGTANYIPKWQDANTLTNSLLFDSGTNVGINSTAPLAPLTIHNPISNAAILELRGGGGSSQSRLLFSYGNGTSQTDQNALILANSSALSFSAFGTRHINFDINSVERMRLDASGNLGLGVVPSAWFTLTTSVLQIRHSSFYSQVDSGNYYTFIGNNYFQDSGTFYKYINTGSAAQYSQFNGQHIWQIAPSGTAGNTITFTQAMTLTANGRLLLGTTTEGTQRLQVAGDVKFDAAAATDGFYWDNTNKRLGIGINIPTVRLHVLGDSILQSTGTGDGTTAIRVNNSVGTQVLAIGAAGGIIMNSSTKISTFASPTSIQAQLELYNGGTGYTTLQSSTSYGLLLNPNGGKVGIGTTSPTGKLHIIGNATDAALNLDSDLSGSYTVLQFRNAGTIKSQIYNNLSGGDLYITTIGASSLSFGTNNAERMRLHHSTGNLSIGTGADSGFKLDVTGTMRVTGDTTFGGNLVIPMGSYDSPSLSFVNDSNTGLYSPLADNLELKTGTNNAVLLENQGVNLMQYSEEIGSFPTNFQNIACTIPGNVVSPDGKTNANLAVPDTSLNQHRLYRIYSTTSPHTMSLYAKAAGYNFISLAWSGGTNGETIIFDIVNGTISGTASNHTAQIENVGNGWFRCSLIFTSSAAAGSFSRWIIVRNANSTAAYSGDGTSGVYVWGWQMEEKTASTSYIKTGASAVTRPQAVSILGSNLYGNLITQKITAPSLNDFAISTDFTDRLIVKSSTGNVGIGTTTPSRKLSVVGTTDIISYSNGTTTGYLYSDNNGVGLFNGATATGTGIYARTSNILDLYYNGNIGLRLNNLGRVLIGSTTDTTETLQVTGTAKITGNLTVDTNTLFVDATNDRVGIGTSSPAYRLTVAGDEELRVIGSSAQTNYLRIGTYIDGTAGSYIAATTNYSASSSSNLIFGTTSTAGVRTDRMLLDASGNLGLGVTPSAWFTAAATSVLQIRHSSFYSQVDGTNYYTFIGSNFFQDSGTFYKYINSSFAALYTQFNGRHIWSIAPSGTAGNNITFTQAMTLYNSGNLAIGSAASDSGQRLQVTGTALITGATNIGGILYAENSGGNIRIKGTTDGGIWTAGSILRLADWATGTKKLDIDLTTGAATFSSSVQAGGGTTNASAILQADSTTKGFLPPRMTAAQRTAIATPPEGLIVFQSDGVVGLYLYVNSAWKSLAIVN